MEITMGQLRACVYILRGKRRLCTMRGMPTTAGGAAQRLRGNRQRRRDMVERCGLGRGRPRGYRAKAREGAEGG